MPISTAPPKAPAKHTPRAPAAPRSPTDVRGAREQGLLGIAQIATLGCVMRGLYADAGAITEHAPSICRETAALADTDENIAKGIDLLVTAGPYTALVAAVLPFGLQIAANHGRIDASRTAMAGIVPPDVLEARVRGQIDAARRQAEEENRLAREAA